MPPLVDIADRDLRNPAGKAHRREAELKAVLAEVPKHGDTWQVGDGMPNDAEYFAGTDPTNSTSLLRITSLSVAGENITMSWTTVGGKGYIVQTNSAAAGGFVDCSPVVLTSGTGENMTNYLDLNGRTNGPFHFYRVRLAP